MSFEEKILIYMSNNEGDVRYRWIEICLMKEKWCMS